MERGRSRLPALPSASPRDELLRFHEKKTKTSPTGESPARACAGRAADPLAIRRAPTPGPARVPPAPGRAGAFPALKHFLLAFIILGAAAVLPGGERARVGRVPRRTPGLRKVWKNWDYETSRAATLLAALEKPTSPALVLVQIRVLAQEKRLHES